MSRELLVALAQRRTHRAALGVSEDEQQLHSQSPSRELETPQHLWSDNVPGDADHEQLADMLIKDHLDRDASIGARQHHCAWGVLLHQSAICDRSVVLRILERLDEPLVPGFEIVQNFAYVHIALTRALQCIVSNSGIIDQTSHVVPLPIPSHRSTLLILRLECARLSRTPRNSGVFNVNCRYRILMSHSPQTSDTSLASWREKLHEIIFEADTPAGKVFDVGLIIAIILSVLVVILSTLKSANDEPYKTIFYALEWIFTILFSIEYVLRLLIVRKPLRYATSFFGIIDLLSILPAFIGIFLPGSGSERLMIVRTLRLLRIFRVFKLARYLTEASALKEAFYISRHKIAVFMTTVLIVILIASALMHVVESGAGNEDFESMPSAMYWAIITMTTVGYGDIIPITATGKATTAALVLVGYSMIIVPTGILSAEIAGVQKSGRVTTRSCPSCMCQGHDPDALYCKKCGDLLNTESK
jgi:voltage-gated potassium channel